MKRLIVAQTERILAATGLFIFAAGSIFVWISDPVKIRFLPACPLLSTTGFACPGCGMTRGFHALLHGDITGALDFNALIPFFALLSGYFSISMILIVVRGRGLPYRRLVQPITLGAILFVMIAFGVVRNLPMYPYSILFP